MIVQAVINEVARNERRNDHSWNTQSAPFKREAVLVMAGTWDGVAGSHSFRRNNVIIKSAMLIPGKDQQTVIPNW